MKLKVVESKNKRLRDLVIEEESLFKILKKVAEVTKINFKRLWMVQEQSNDNSFNYVIYNKQKQVAVLREQ